MKAYLVSATSLAEKARRYGMGDVLMLGVGEEKTGGRKKDSLLANLFEVMIAGVYIDGGIEPVWCPCGQLFYRKANRWFATPISTEPELHWGAPHVAFETDFIDTPGRSYDVSPDGRRLLVVKHVEGVTTNKLHVVSNWREGLKRQATGKSGQP